MRRTNSTSWVPEVRWRSVPRAAKGPRLPDTTLDAERGADPPSSDDDTHIPVDDGDDDGATNEEEERPPPRAIDFLWGLRVPAAAALRLRALRTSGVEISQEVVDATMEYLRLHYVQVGRPQNSMLAPNDNLPTPCTARGSPPGVDRALQCVQIRPGFLRQPCMRGAPASSLSSPSPSSSCTIRWTFMGTCIVRLRGSGTIPTPSPSSSPRCAITTGSCGSRPPGAVRFGVRIRPAAQDCRPSDRRLGRQSCRHPVTRMPHISHLFSSHLHDCFREAGFGTATFINLGSEQQEDQSNDCGLFVLRNVSLLLAAGSQIPWTIPRGGARAPRLADLCAGRPAVSGADMRAGPAAVRVSEVDIWVRREMERLFLINFLGHPSLPLHPFGRQPGAGLHRLLVRLCGAHGITPTMDALVAGLCNPLLYPPASRGHRRYDPNG